MGRREAPGADAEGVRDARQGRLWGRAERARGTASRSAPSVRPGLRAAAFVAGAGVMAVEMADSRLLTPAFGASLLVWANLIGVILLAMAVGYRVGGRLADRRPAAAGLFGALLASGALTSLLPLAGKAAINALGAAGIVGSPVGVILASFAGVLAVAAPPVFLLAFATPFAIRLGATSVEGTGEVAGTLGAWSTAGSMLGTFVPAFLTIPLWGTRATLLGVGVLLILTGAIGLRRLWPLALLLVPAAVAVLASGVLRPVPGLLFEAETPYQFVQVVRQGGLTALVVNEGGGIQSAWRQGTPLTGMYYDNYMLLPFLRPGRSRRVLVIGSGGGTILRQYHQVLGAVFHLQLRGVELDPVVASLGPRFFGVSPALQADVRVGDGRAYLRRAGRYNIIIVDAYARQLYIPREMATVQFFRLVRQHLLPGGIVAMNVNAYNLKSPLLQSIVRTAHAAFPYTYEAKVSGPYNYLVAGSDLPLDPALLSSPAVLPLLRSLGASTAAAWHPDAGAGGMLLTDNRAPLDYLTDFEILRAIRAGAAANRPVD